MITLHTTKGDITIQPDFENAPISAQNFVDYAREGFYEGTIFHRVIEDFMIQGGGMTPDMETKETKETITNEANNGLKNVRGSVAMARTPAPHSASSQFFINLKDNDFLNFRSEDSQGWGYAVFAEVTAGMDVVDTIRAVETGRAGPHQDVPVDPIIIEKVSVEE